MNDTMNFTMNDTMDFAMYDNDTMDFAMNDTMNGSEDDASSEQMSHALHVLSLVVFTITCVLGIPGNALVIWIVGVKMKKTVNTIWYVNLAVADLLCCLSIPFVMGELVLQYWPYGLVMCKLLSSAINVNMFASVFTLTLISLDRFAMVIYPVWTQNHRSIFKAGLLCGLVWFLALILSLPEPIYMMIVEYDNVTFCDYTADQQTGKAIHITSLLFALLIPLLVISVCYLLIYRKLRVGKFKSQKALRVMVAVVTAFFVCWVPYHTLSLVIEFGEESSAEVAHSVHSLAVALVYINSCVNPVVYVFMGQDFRKRVVSLRRIIEHAFSEDATSTSGSSKRNVSRVTNSTDAQL